MESGKPTSYFEGTTADATLIRFGLEQDGIRILEYLPKPTHMWKER
jgi:hypothetical protein